MGRKPILPSQRAQPISFSLKPHLIEKIDDYASDLRFSRSKFLQQAVTEYMTRHIVNPNDTDLSSNVHDMTLDRRVAVGLAALQQANAQGLTIAKPIMDALRRELNMLTENDLVEQESNEKPTIRWGEPVSFDKVGGADLTTYHVLQYDSNNRPIIVGIIQRNPNFTRKWSVIVNREPQGLANSLKLAKAYFTDGTPLQGV